MLSLRFLFFLKISLGLVWFVYRRALLLSFSSTLLLFVRGDVNLLAIADWSSRGRSWVPLPVGIFLPNSYVECGFAWAEDAVNICNTGILNKTKYTFQQCIVGSARMPHSSVLLSEWNHQNHGKPFAFLLMLVIKSYSTMSELKLVPLLRVTVLAFPGCTEPDNPRTPKEVVLKYNCWPAHVHIHPNSSRVESTSCSRYLDPCFGRKLQWSALSQDLWIWCKSPSSI